MQIDRPIRDQEQQGSRLAAFVGLVMLVAAEVGAVALLVHLGSRHPFDLGPSIDAWAAATPEDALAGALRWVALLAAGWLLVTTAVDVVTVACTRRARVGAAGARLRVAPRAVRRLVDRALVAGMAVGVAVAPGVAHAQRSRHPTPPVVSVVRDGRAGGLASLPSDPGAATAPRTPVAPSTPARPAPPPVVAAPTPVAPPPATVVVEPGDSLWDIAAREVARATGRARDAVPDAEVAPYWIAVCDANASHLASGDTDIVHAGETVMLPPVT